MLYLKEASDNLQPQNFYQLSADRQHRTLDVLDRAIDQFPYLLQLPTLYQNLAEIWRLTITQDLLEPILQTKVEELLIHIHATIQQLELPSSLVVAIADDTSATTNLPNLPQMYSHSS